MNIQQAFKFCKRYFSFTDESLGEYLGISRSQVTKINGGYSEGLTISVLKRISQLLRISIDELVDNRFLPPSYHFSKHIYSIYFHSPEDFPQWSIMKNDILYIRPYVFDTSKIGQLVIRISGDSVQLMELKPVHATQQFDFHVVGISRFLYKPIEDIEYQNTLSENGDPSRLIIRRGRPIKYD